MSTFVYPPVQLSTTGSATEAKQDVIISELQDQEVLLTTIAGDTTSLDTKVTKADTDDVTITASALPTGAATAANQTTANASLANVESDLADLNAKLAASLVPEAYDEIEITYVTVGNGVGSINTVVYKLSSTTVATLTLSYDGSDRLSGVVKS